MRGITRLCVGLVLVGRACTGWAGEPTDGSLEHLEQYSSTVHSREEEIRLLQLDLEKVRIEAEIRKIKAGPSEAEVKPGNAVTGEAAAIPVVLSEGTLRSTYLDRERKTACFLQGTRESCFCEGEKWNGQEIRSIRNGEVTLAGPDGTDRVMATGL